MGLCIGNEVIAKILPENKIGVIVNIEKYENEIIMTIIQKDGYIFKVNESNLCSTGKFFPYLVKECDNCLNSCKSNCYFRR